jgi:hypothetical protein
MAAPDPPPGARASRPSPLDTASLPSRLAFAWVAPLIRAGSARPLAADDLFGLQRCDTAAVLVARLERPWAAQVQWQMTLAACSELPG